MFDQHPTQPAEIMSEEKETPTAIRVMPGKFLRPERKLKIPRFVWIGLGVLFLAGIASSIVLWQQGLIFRPAQKPPIEKKPIPPIVEEKPISPKEPIITPTLPLTSPAQVLEKEVRDEQGNLIGSAKLTLPEGSINPPEADIFLTGSLPGPDEKNSQYQIINGVYRIKSKEPVTFLKPLDLIIKYNQEDLEKYGINEAELEIVSLREEGWQIEESKLDSENKEIKITLKEFSPYPFALVVASEKIKETKPENIIVETTLPSSLDSDKDGLTDEEEALYKTRKDLLDTDQDSYPDGLEIVNLYNPLSGPEDRLSLSGLVNSYTNPIYNYTLFYPSAWLAKAIDETNDEVLFTSATGEFIEVIIQGNPRQLLALDWYLEKSPDLKASEVRIANLDGLQAIWSSDGQSLYLAKDDKIYGLIYNSGARKDLNFKATYTMMIKGFRVLEEKILPKTEEMETKAAE